MGQIYYHLYIEKRNVYVDLCFRHAVKLASEGQDVQTVQSPYEDFYLDCVYCEDEK